MAKSITIVSVLDTDSALTIKKKKSGYFSIRLRTAEFEQSVDYTPEQMTEILTAINILL